MLPWFITGEQKKLDILNACFSSFNRAQAYFFFSWSRGVCEKTREEIIIFQFNMLIIHVYCLKTQSFPKLKKCVNSSVNSMTNLANNETFDQSEHDTRIWYNGTAASKACLQALPLFPPPQSTTQLTLLAKFFFAVHPFPTAEPGPTLYIPRKRVFLCLTLYTHLTTNRPIKGPKTMDIKYTEPAMYADSFLVKSKVSL